MEPEPIHFLYTYNCGGLADMIKGSSTVWFIAKQSNRPFRISFHHAELNHIFPSKVFDPNSRNGHILKMIDSKDSKNVIAVAKEHKYVPLYILSNTSLDYFDIFPDYIEEIKPYIQSIYTTHLPIEKSIVHHSEFQVLHCRMGDLYLDEATNNGDNRIKTKDHFEKCLKIYKNTYSNKYPVLVCSDHKSTRDHILQQIPNSFVPSSTPYHFAYNTKKEKSTEIIKRTRETIQEHELMSRAVRIHKMAYSGFPIIASVIGNIPIFILDPSAQNGCKPYVSDWTPLQ